jgi:3-hydroxyisobutyrate dehydrogenase
MTQVGWIGLGAMGRPMATRLLDSGHQVVGYDVDPGAVAVLGDRGKPAASPAEAAAGADVLAVMVATGAQAEDASPSGVCSWWTRRSPGVSPARPPASC